MAVGAHGGAGGPGYSEVRRMTWTKNPAVLEAVAGAGKGENSRDVYTGDATRELGIEPGDPEYEIRLADLLRAGYLLPSADQNLTAQGAHQITDEGIAAVDES
jgi:hypothetical protein